MLRIKRASAGSGKTYELAKTYIKLLITTRHKEGKRLLLKNESFRENLSSILAVTFTVKATAEMKQRIVEKLADLSRADDPGLTWKELKKIDYLEELIADFQSNPAEIAFLAKGALRTLLLHFSEFRVQTIDSFFQSILHTFAYEANLDDNFNMVVNTDLVTSAGFDIALDDISDISKAKDGTEETLHWLRRMMEGKGGTKWNVFTREFGGNTLYGELIKEAKNLQSEAYQQVMEDLKKYFSGLDRPFREVMDELDEANIGCWKSFYEQSRKSALRLVSVLKEADLDTESVFSRQGGYLNKSCLPFEAGVLSELKPVRKGKGEDYFSLSDKGRKRLYAQAGGDMTTIATLVTSIDNAFLEWMEANNRMLEEFMPYRDGALAWIEYRVLLPKLMLVMEIARRKDEYLKAVNSLQISDTAHILSNIIGDDDAPFVYERMGSRISHYLIDEFQDTSRLQWRNLRPLLQESEASDKENLIIGDAKQSIYRFRNADYTIITGLENEFFDIVYHTRETRAKKCEEVNTNFRSKPKVVEFNNYVFSSLTEITDDKGEPQFPPNVVEVYGDCRQAIAPHMIGGPEGYVEAVFYNHKTNIPSDADDRNLSEKESQLGFAELPERIMQLRGRGYSFRDIGILVRKHEEGMTAISVISKYNAAHKDNPIPVISEENLLVASALSVKIIVHALRMAAGSSTPRTEDNPVLGDPIGEMELSELMASLPSVALPALTEAIVKRFVPETRRNEEAPFIAAFQDAVVDYCAGRPGDVGSFLKWWRQKSTSLCITSPEESDGVHIQTIHKAKGLEYKCVILPLVDFSFVPTGNLAEWRWVKTSPEVRKAELLPPHLPVLTRSVLGQTPHKEEYETYKKEVALDELNKMYVAFTRAIDELYLYIPTSSSAGKNARTMLRSLLVTGSCEIEERTVVSFGAPISFGDIRKEKEKEDEKRKKRSGEVMPLRNYGSDGFPAYRPQRIAVNTGGEEGKPDLDPRAEGTLKHRIMQMVEKASDLPKALLRLKAEGLVSSSKIDQWGKELRDAMEKEEGRRWFAEGMKSFNERPVIRRGRTYRPDRFIVTPDGDAIIIDYKFGDREDDNIRQIKEYASLLRETGSYRCVSAYLWYFSDQTVVPVA